MAKIGRASEEDSGLLEKENDEDIHVIFWQEVTVDGFRHSDWLVCTHANFVHMHAYTYTHAHL